MRHRSARRRAAEEDAAATAAPVRPPGSAAVAAMGENAPTSSSRPVPRSLIGVNISSDLFPSSFSLRNGR